MSTRAYSAASCHALVLRSVRRVSARIHIIVELFFRSNAPFNLETHRDVVVHKKTTTHLHLLKQQRGGIHNNHEIYQTNLGEVVLLFPLGDGLLGRVSMRVGKHPLASLFFAILSVISPRTTDQWDYLRTEIE